MGLVNNFSAPTAWPNPIAMQLLNNCGNIVTNGQIVVTFTSGDAPLALALADPSTGLYSATWTPRKSAGQVNINARATAPGFATVTSQLVGAVTSNAAPQLAPNSTQNIYNPLAGAGLAPGTLVQITGTALAGSASANTPGTALPTTINGTQVIIGGLPAPLSSVAPGVLNAEVPAGLASGMQYQVIVNANGALTTPDTISLGDAAPGIATGMGGVLTASHADGTAVTSASPATPGEALVMTGVGLGKTDTPVADGAVTPATPPANALIQPTLTIDGKPATVSFAGLKPGAVGVYEIDFTVPADAANGDLALVLSQGDQPSNTAVVTVKKK
jgi:uncharacterized protein (TIGR03437 family)